MGAGLGAGKGKMEWLLEVALLLLLSVTLFHAVRLERALGILRRDRGALEKLVDSFTESTAQADQSIERLGLASEGAGRQMARQIESGSSLRQDLTFLAERGDALADRLDGLVRSARATQPGITSGERGPAAVASEPAPRLRSQAERDLVKALKLVR